MFKIIITIFLLLTAGLIIFWIFYPKATNKKEDQNITGEIKGVKISKPEKVSLEVSSLTKAIIDTKEKVAQSLESIKENVHDTLQAALDTTLGEKPKSDNLVSVQIQENKDAILTPDLYDVNLSLDNGLKLKFIRSKSYYLKFQNIPTSYCLFINNNKYTINEKSLVELKFSSTGIYYLKTNLCTSADKNVGEITVD